MNDNSLSPKKKKKKMMMISGRQLVPLHGSSSHFGTLS